MTSWRYHALRLFPEREWLHRDLPLKDMQIAPALSGPQALSATLEPDVAGIQDSQGRPLLQDWNTLIVAEADGIIRGGGILDTSTFTGQKWELELTGFSTLPKGQAMTATLAYGGDNATGRDADGPTSGVGADPIQIVKDLWAQVQAKPRGDLGVTFGGSSSTKYRSATWHYIFDVWTFSPDASTTVEISYPTSATADDNGVYPAKTLNTVAINGTGFTKKKTRSTDAKLPAGKHVYWEYHLYDYDVTDVGQKIDDLTQATPFDWVEAIDWADAAKSDIRLRIDFGYPRLGRNRPDLRFVEGENVTEVIVVKTGGDDYANAVIALGAGEGKDQIRAEVTKDDGLLRREKVVTATWISDKTQLKQYATAYLNTLTGSVDIEGFTLRQHPNASFAVGDDVTVQVATGWAAGMTLKVRITGYAYAPDTDTISVTCKRSSAFSYTAQVTN